MQPIPVKRNKEDLKQQINYLIRQDFIVSYGAYKSILWYLAGATFIVLAIAIFTSPDDFVAFKGVSLIVIAIAWLAAILFCIKLLLKLLRCIKWKRKAIEIILQENDGVYISFDEQKITYKTKKFTSAVNWSYYNYYSINKSSVFIIPAYNMYDAVYFSANDIGAANFDQLKAVVKDKLTLIGS